MIPARFVEGLMRRFVEGTDRGQSTLFPECQGDWIGEDNPVRVIDVFVEEIDLGELGFSGVEPEATGRPSYHPSVLLKLYIYGYLNRVQSSRRLEREAGRNVEVMWLTGRLVPITRRLPTSARTTAVPSARSAPGSKADIAPKSDFSIQVQKTPARTASQPKSFERLSVMSPLHPLSRTTSARPSGSDEQDRSTTRVNIAKRIGMFEK
jgi:hypothetical protein